MKLKESRITLRVSGEGATIELKDRVSKTTFAVVNMTAEQFMAALGGLGYAECETEVYGLDKVGRKHENKDLEFEIPENWASSSYQVLLHSRALLVCPEGWTPDKYYGSQTSFFKKEGKQYARAIIRRWIDAE